MDQNQLIADRISSQLGAQQLELIRLGVLVETLTAQAKYLQDELDKKASPSDGENKPAVQVSE